ncbi:hypothetical protein ACOSQ3_013915 [Xanthoceras sorbifolium]
MEEEEEEESLGVNWKKIVWVSVKKIGRIIWVSTKKLFGSLGVQKKYCLEKNIGRRRRRKFGCLQKNCLGVFLVDEIFFLKKMKKKMNNLIVLYKNIFIYFKLLLRIIKY